MRDGLEVGEYDSGPNRSRRLLGVVILLLFITGCIGLQVLLYLASSDSENRLWRVGILANSTADYSLDENIRVAPISPQILEELAREDARSSPTPSMEVTPPVIGRVSPSQPGSTEEGKTSTPIASVQPTAIPTGSESPVTPTPKTPTSSTSITPTSATPSTTFTPATPLPTTKVPTTVVPTTKVPTTPAATTTIPPTPVPTTRVPTTPAATTTIPPTPKPTTMVPTTPAATTTIPPTPVPTTQAPTPTPIPTSTELTEVPTIWIPPTDPPTLTEESPPGTGLDSNSTPVPPRRLQPIRLDVYFLKFKSAPQSCQLYEPLSYSIEIQNKIMFTSGALRQVGIKISFFGNG